MKQDETGMKNRGVRFQINKQLDDENKAVTKTWIDFLHEIVLQLRT